MPLTSTVSYVSQTGTLGSVVDQGQRSDTRHGILDPFELQRSSFSADYLLDTYRQEERSAAFDSLEYSVYAHAIRQSSYHAILNEKDSAYFSSC